MTTLLIPLLQVLDVALQLYLWVVIIAVILSWLVAFSVINTHNQAVRAIGGALHQLTEPVLSRIRRIVPMVGGLDISPVILALVILFIRLIIQRFILNLSL